MTEQNPIHVIGLGLSGASSLSPKTLALVESADLLVGAQRHLDAFSYLWAEVSNGLSVAKSAKSIDAWPLGNFSQVFARVRSHLDDQPDAQVVILASGDPLFFGLGRLLLAAFSPEQLMFHPQVSAIQLAFSRLKLPWQNATLISVHGRDEQSLIQAVKRGDSRIAVLTDGRLTPEAIAKLITALAVPVRYQLWVCENLGSDAEHLSSHWPRELALKPLPQPFAALNVVVLLRQDDSLLAAGLSPRGLPLIGLPDAVFLAFPDRPTLLTKREIRLLILGAVAPLPAQTIWDIGAGTGSVSIELSRLCPTAQVYAIEKTAMGTHLIQQNAQRLAASSIQVIQGKAPSGLIDLPAPDRVFIGGSSGQLVPILEYLHDRMSEPLNGQASPPRIVLAIATLEHLSQVITWARQPTIQSTWQIQMTQANISRSLPVGPLTRFNPLTPITLVTLDRIRQCV